jgi:hypothetical protein
VRGALISRCVFDASDRASRTDRPRNGKYNPPNRLIANRTLGLAPNQEIRSIFEDVAGSDSGGCDTTDDCGTQVRRFATLRQLFV